MSASSEVTCAPRVRLPLVGDEATVLDPRWLNERGLDIGEHLSRQRLVESRRLEMVHRGDLRGVEMSRRRADTIRR
jgi:hypothetical protein